MERFAYGEWLEGPHQRSLGFRLLSPIPETKWAGEVEALARRLQAAPYPEYWGETDLFCSVLLEQGQRLVALARYGLKDHTPSGRHGGLEFVGVVSIDGDAAMSIPSALAIYEWLKREREACDDLRKFQGETTLIELLTEAPTPPIPPAMAPVLPVQFWQEGALAFAARTAGDADSHLAMLEQAQGDRWQWLPLIGTDFPLTAFAKRGPVIAWTPHVTGMAWKIDTPPAAPPVAAPASWWSTGMQAIICLFLLINGWFLYRLASTGVTKPRELPEVRVVTPVDAMSVPISATNFETTLERLHQLLIERNQISPAKRERLLATYANLVQQDPALKVESVAGQLALAALWDVAKQPTREQIETMILNLGSEQKGLDPEVLQLIATKLSRQLR